MNYCPALYLVITANHKPQHCRRSRIHITSKMAEKDESSSSSHYQLTDEEIDQICSSVYPVLFRFGILLGVDINELDQVINDPSRDSWSKCRRVIERWKLNTSSDKERGIMSKVLSTVRYSRFSFMIDPTGKAAASLEKTIKDPTSLSVEEIDMVCHELSSNWEMLGAHLSISQGDIMNLKTRQITSYQKAYTVVHMRSLMAGIDRVTIVGILKRMGRGRLAKQIS